MTLLEFICEKLLGPPTSRSSDRSTYHCPRHEDNHPSFCTLPHKPEFKDRFKCWSCYFSGDEFDLLREFFPNENFGQHQIRLAAFRRDFERETKSNASGMKTTFSLRGPGSTSNMKLQNAYDRDPMEDGFTPEASSAFDSLQEYVNELPTDSDFRELLVAQKALEICAQYGLHPGGFAILCGFVIWTTKTDRQHLTECNDPECDAIVCRAERGLPPMTREEIEAGRREAQKARRQRRAIRKRPDSPASQRKLVTMKGIPKRKLRAR